MSLHIIGGCLSFLGFDDTQLESFKALLKSTSSLSAPVASFALDGIIFADFCN
jgi:hypothetical protein